MNGYAFQAQLNRISPIGLVAEGLRIDVGFAGTLTAGPLAGAAIEGVDYLLIRPDGVGVIDAFERIAGPDGLSVSVHASGYVVPPLQLPDLPALLDPAFSWPDLGLPVHGSARMQSALGLPAGANRTVFAFTGSVNMARGTLQVDAVPVETTRAHPNQTLLAQGYAAFAAGDVPAVMKLFAPDIAWHEPGSGPLAGDYRGRDAVGGFFGRIMELSGGTFQLEIHDIIADDDQAVALVTAHATRGGRQLAARGMHVWRVDRETLTSFTSSYTDPASVDQFWSQPA